MISFYNFVNTYLIVQCISEFQILWHKLNNFSSYFQGYFTKKYLFIQIRQSLRFFGKKSVWFTTEACIKGMYSFP